MRTVIDRFGKYVERKKLVTTASGRAEYETTAGKLIDYLENTTQEKWIKHIYDAEMTLAFIAVTYSDVKPKTIAEKELHIKTFQEYVHTKEGRLIQVTEWINHMASIPAVQVLIVLVTVSTAIITCVQGIQFIPSVIEIASGYLSPTITVTQPPSDCSTLPPPLLHPSNFGAVIKADNPDSYIAVYKEASINAEIIAALETHQSVQILSEPLCHAGLRWFSVDYGGLQPGWINDIRTRDEIFEYLIEPVVMESVPRLTDCASDFFFGTEQGCPSSEATDAHSAYQMYEHGFMVWRAKPDEFFVFMNDDAMFVYDSDFVATLPDNQITDMPPTERVRPVSGFGRIWGYFDRVRDQLGWATTSEKQYISKIQYVDLVSTPVEDKILFYLTLPDQQVVASGIRQEGRYWRFVL